MARIVVASLKSRAKGHGAVAPVTKKRVKDAGGHMKTLRTLDAGSRTFGDDLRQVFGSNVAKARRDNKQAIGAPDIAVEKR